MRNPDVTCTKAVGIMLMVLCHAGIGCQDVVAFVYMFHMPLFFFLSGYCLKEKHFAQPHVFAWRRVKGVWWPYAKWSLVFLALHNLFFALNIYNGEYGWQGNGSHLYGWGEIVERAGGILLLMHKHEQLLGGYWFMRTLLRGSLIAFALLWLVHITNRKTKLHTAYGLIVGGGILLTLCLLLDHAHRTLTVLFLSPQDFAAALFFLIGHVFQRFHVRKFRLWEWLLAAGLVLVGSRFWHMEMADVCYDNRLLLPYLVTAVLGTWMIYSLPWQRLCGRAATMVRFVGDSTLTILTWHFLSFKLVSLLIIYMYGLPIARLAEFPVIEEYSGQGWWLAYFLGALLATCAIASCNRHLRSPWLKL